MDKSSEQKVKDAALRWIGAGNITQRELATKMGIAPPGLSQMLTTDKALPFLRLMQAIYHLKPPTAEVDDIFALYCDSLDIPRGALRLTLGRVIEPNAGAARARIHTLVDKIEDNKLAIVEAMLKGLIDE